MLYRFIFYHDHISIQIFAVILSIFEISTFNILDVVFITFVLLPGLSTYLSNNKTNNSVQDELHSYCSIYCFIFDICKNVETTRSLEKIISVWTESAKKHCLSKTSQNLHQRKSTKRQINVKSKHFLFLSV